MKNPLCILSFCLFFASLQNNAQAQTWSTQVTFSPHNTMLIGDASRFEYHHNCHSTFYMRYNDSSYYCNTVYLTATYTPLTGKTNMKQDFVITDFKRFSSLYQGFIGSFEGVAMYGQALKPVNYTYYFQYFKLPAIKRLNRMAAIESAPPSTHIKLFATGEKDFSKAPPQSYILELYAHGMDFTPYYYAPLAYDPATSQRESADDVITLENYVIFATRDTRPKHAPVNLRISDTTSTLLSVDINVQWQFFLPSDRTLLSELRLRHLVDDIFTLSYIVYDDYTRKNYLCIHEIHLHDFLAEDNLIVCGEVEIEDVCTNLVDIIYEPDVNTMVALLKGNGVSRLYHLDPLFVDMTVTKLDYSDGELYSIDTIGTYIPLNEDMYVAMGDDRFFSQDISTGVYIENSCLNVTSLKMSLSECPKVIKKVDPINSYSDNKIYYQESRPYEVIEGVRTCGEMNIEGINIIAH